MATALTPLWAFLRVTEEDRAPVTLESSLPCPQSEIKVLTHFSKTSQGQESQLDGGWGAACFFGWGRVSKM